MSRGPWNTGAARLEKVQGIDDERFYNENKKYNDVNSVLRGYAAKAS